MTFFDVRRCGRVPSGGASGSLAAAGFSELRAIGRGLSARFPFVSGQQRTGQGAQIIRHQQAGYFVGATVVSDGEHLIKIYWSAAQRTLNLDARPIRRLSEYLGVLRAVVFSSEDLQLVKGPASRRRRFLDLLLTQTAPGYLTLLQRYSQALRSRNALLKRTPLDEAALESFTRELIESGTELNQRRHALMPDFIPIATAAYTRITGGAEALTLRYRPSVKSDFLVELAQSRGRERTFRSTLIGPHRDELSLEVNERVVDEFGSEGQKRSVAISLKMAQAEYLTQIHGVPPVLLIDDIMGELDANRRAAFLPLLHRVDRAGSQVFMTATEESWPRELGARLHRWQVQAGVLALRTGDPSL